ncbi:P-loop containing nucleoside triphosphate hydrolase protein, partial [Bombardia bombarda]
LRELDTDQWTAYMRLKSIPRGVCIVPGGAGAGKTRWSLLVAAMAQMRRPTKVLYLIDINKPLDDTASKMMRIYKDLGMKKNVIRMLKWPRELEKNGIEQKIREVEAQNKETEAGSEKSTKGKHEDEFRPPTLDEAACRHYMANKHTGKYSGVGYFLGIREIVAHDPVLRFSQGPENFSYAMKNLYRDVLGEADFIATTPVAAFCHFDGMFKPDLVFLDECGHARELSTLIPIAFFDPAAWFFVGDYRQTSPYVGCRDEECDPLHMSMMERIAKSGPTPLIRTQLLTNHRAWGDLQRLASQLFYGGRMRSDRPDGENFPASLRNLHEYFESFRTEQDFQAERSRVPRFVVHAGGREEEVCRSFWNPTHHQWVMNCVMQLLHAPWFLQTDGSAKGTILIVSPYREGADKYKAAVEAIEPPEMRERVQARTVGTVQGAEADVVFVDMAKQRASPHTNDPKRLCVALTRAKQAEIIMMSERM